MLMQALSKSVAQLGDPRFIAIFAKSMLITLLLTIALGFGLGQGLSLLIDRWVDASATVGVDGIARAIGIIFMFVFGFRAIAVPVLSFYGDEIAAAVEARHYADNATKARRVSLGISARLALLSLGRFLLFNLLAVPLYLFLLLTAIGPLILFLIINGLLLGRDLGEMVAVRHVDRPAMKAWLRASRFDRALLGLGVTLLFMIPFANLIAPVLGAAMATHLFHGKTA